MRQYCRIFNAIAIFVFAIIFMSCNNDQRDIPSGFVGKMLTPTGWDVKILEAGQVNIGTENMNGTSTSLVLLEATTITVKETFMLKDSTDNQDHRVRTKDGSPLIVDIYEQVAIPVTEKTRNGIFAMVTPTATSERRVSKIMVQDVYNRFAKMTIRGNVRGIFAKYKDAEDIYQNFDKVNAEIVQMINQIIKDSGSPFEITSAQLSNVQEDPIVLASKNKMIATRNEIQSIEMIGKAIRDNPGYLEARRLDVLEKIGANSNSNLVIMDTKNSTTLALPIQK